MSSTYIYSHILFRCELQGHVCKCAHTYISANIKNRNTHASNTHGHTKTDMDTYMHACVYSYTHLHTHINTKTHASMHARAHAHTQTHNNLH